MLSLSQEYAKAGAGKVDLFQALAVGSWIFLLCGLLYRFRLVPPALAAFGLVGSVFQITGVTLRALWGYPPEPRLAMPLAPAYGSGAVADRQGIRCTASRCGLRGVGHHRVSGQNRIRKILATTPYPAMQENLQQPGFCSVILASMSIA